MTLSTLKPRVLSLSVNGDYPAKFMTDRWTVTIITAEAKAE